MLPESTLIAMLPLLLACDAMHFGVTRTTADTTMVQLQGFDDRVPPPALYPFLEGMRAEIESHNYPALTTKGETLQFVPSMEEARDDFDRTSSRPGRRPRQKQAPHQSRVTTAGLKLNFIFFDAGNETTASDCGGCMVLLKLARILERMGYSVTKDSEPCRTFQKKTAAHINVFISPESIYSEKYVGKKFCRIRPHATVRWILAPVGINVPANVTESWDPDDLVFNYGILSNGAAMPVPLTNLLQTQMNPFDGDGMDVTSYAQEQRNGSIFIMRKAERFQKQIKIMHGPEAQSGEGGNMSEYLQRYLRAKKCYCYDPYSFHLQIAAMMGCISIQAPLGNFTKAEWLGTTLYAGYLADNNLSNMLGIAYGASTSELAYAERTMSGAREELFRVREWGEKVTVPRMIRDIESYIVRGARSGFEGAVLVRDMYPHKWWQGCTNCSFMDFSSFMNRSAQRLQQRSVGRRLEVLGAY